MRTLKLILSGWQSVGLVVFIMLFFNMEGSGKGKITKNAPVFTQCAGNRTVLFPSVFTGAAGFKLGESKGQKSNLR